MFNDLPVWAYILITLGFTHITIAAVTIYLHRYQTHRALILNPLTSHFFRFWLWLTTGMRTIEWVAIHRKHHARVETAEDPHSPQILGIKTVLFTGAELYRRESLKQETIAKYGFNTPDDWLERNLYHRFNSIGISLMLMLDVVLFGFVGITVWAVQMLWIPFFAAGVINGIGHWWGYRNFESADASTNIIPFGVLIGGEELHNNHHAFASSARFSNKWYEIDLGWYYIRILELLGMARVKKVAPEPVTDRHKQKVDQDTVRAVVTNRLHIMSDYASSVVRQVYREEAVKASLAKRRLMRKYRRLLIRHEALLDSSARQHLAELFHYSGTLYLVYEFRQRLQALWQEKTADQESILNALQEWCRQAEETGVVALQEFAAKLKTYTVASSTNHA
jgi:stearoyl-CoA desaturase (delta-9 desaturase)